jgi:hypothetical protein
MGGKDNPVPAGVSNPIFLMSEKDAEAKEPGA